MRALNQEDTVAAPPHDGTAPAQPDWPMLDSADPLPGATAALPSPHIGRYEVRRLLGRGGMGCVYQAFDPVLEREVALKVMLAEIVGDPEQKQRFEREARAVARLSHPAVVTVFDLGYHTDGSPYIVMELLRGQDLLARMRAEPALSTGEKVSIVSQILGGLGHAHRTGIVHRDVKPANVFLTEEGMARIMDFGLALFTSSAATSRCIMGTVAYMSAEQARGERLDGRSDLFSVGTLLCEMLTGRRPFEAETPASTLYRIVNGEPTITVPADPEARQLLPVLRRALARNPDERYQTAADFAAALRAGTESARPASVGGPAATFEPAGATVVPSSSPSPAPPAAPVPSRPPSPSPASSPTPSTRPPAPASDRQADPSGLFRLLREIYVGGKTGQLHVAVGAQRKSLRILSGRILHGSSDAEGEHLGDVLVRFGLLGQSDLERAVAVVLHERKRLGAVLAQMGLLEKEALEEAVGIHVREILFSAIDRAEATFAFEELADTSFDTDLVCPQSMGQVILEATRRVFDPGLVRRLLGDTRRVLMLSPDPLLRTQKITLTPADGFVLSRVDGTLSAREIMELIPLPAEDAERSLFSLLCTGIIGYRGEGPGRPASPRDATGRLKPQAPPAPATPPPAAFRAPSVPGASASTPSARPSPPAPPPTPIPPPPPTPTPLAAQTAPPAIGVAEMRSLLEASARPRRDPYEVLGLEPTADEEEVRLAYARLARILHPDAALDPGLEDLRRQRGEAFVQLGQAYDTLRSPGFRQHAAERAARLRGRSTPAPRQEEAPSPRAATPAPEKPAASRPTTAPERRAEVAPQADPEQVVLEARQHIEREKYWEAIQLLEPLVPHAEGATRFEARILLAQAYLKNPRWRKRAEEIVLDLLRERPHDVPAHLLLAEIYRASGLVARARAAYQKVLAVQPQNGAASRGLAELEPRVAPVPPSRLRGIFRKG